MPGALPASAPLPTTLGGAPVPDLSTSAWVVVAGVAALVLLNAATVLVYALDKRAARRRTRRVSERALLTLGLLGGWPGAVLAQRTFRHKTAKASFRHAFVLTVVLNTAVAAVVAWLVVMPGR